MGTSDDLFDELVETWYVSIQLMSPASGDEEGVTTVASVEDLFPFN